jgi:hypothetical protein
MDLKTAAFRGLHTGFCCLKAGVRCFSPLISRISPSKSTSVQYAFRERDVSGGSKSRASMGVSFRRYRRFDRIQIFSPEVGEAAGAGGGAANLLFDPLLPVLLKFEMNKQAHNKNNNNTKKKEEMH